MLHRISVPVAVSILSLCSIARAEQFGLVDVSYTHSAETTKDSHFYVKPPADAPKDWTNPVDYSMGSVHIIVDVKTKPAGDTPTKFQVCFEGTPSYACTLQSPTYTTIGRVEWDSPFKDFWYESTVDWSQGTKQIPLILKDTMNNKPAGDPKYMPTDLHVQVSLVSPGAKFAPPPAAGSGGSGAAGSGAGSGAAGAAAGGRGGAGAGAGVGGQSGAAAAANGGGGAGGASPNPIAGRAAGGAGAAASIGTSGTSGSSDSGAASPAPSATAGAVGAMTGAQTAAGRDAATNSDSGCRSAGSGSSGGWMFGVAALAFIAARRRRRQASPRRPLGSVCNEATRERRPS